MRSMPTSRKNMAVGNSLFIDTSGWMALLRSDESEHTTAIDLFDSYSNSLTTNYVLAELIPLANSRGLPRKTTHKFIREIEASELVQVVWVENEFHEHAMKLLESRLDKNYSLCDAVSFIVMRKYGLTDALTTDKHFEQEGFVRLLEL